MRKKEFSPVISVESCGDTSGAITAVNKKTGLGKDDRKSKARLIEELRAAGRKIAVLERAKDALKVNEELYRLLFVNSGDAILLAQPDGTISAANPEACRMFGRSEKEIKKIGRAGIVASKDSRIPTALEERHRTGQFKGELNYVKKDGIVFPGDVTTKIFKDSSGNERTVTIIRDLTERKQAVAELIEREMFNFALFEYNPIQTVVVDLVGKVIKFNLAKKKSGDRLPNIGDTMYKDYAGKHEIDMYAELMKCIRSGEEKEFPEQKYGDRVLSTTISPFPKGAVIISEDITEGKRAEEEIRKNHAELKAFVYMVSHDLKNPVISIQGFCSLLMKNHRKDLNEKALFYIQRVQANSSLMTNLLEDLVELSRIGRIEDKKTKISVQEVIKSVWAEASTSLATQNVEFVSPENLPQLCYSEKRLYQIFYNLLYNALKFRDEERKTKVEIGHQEDKDNYTFFVRDNGIGIEQKYHNKIFESFSQLKDIKSEGTGMGLAIVKKIVEANQGKVWVESQKGAGSTFYFTIPKNVTS